MLPIIVLGSGMIPRIGRLAPMKQPREVDLETLEVIIDTGCMRPVYIDDSVKPARKIVLTANNYKKMWEKYATGVKKPAPPKKTKPPFKPPVKPAEPKKETTPPAPPQIPFAVTIDENNVKTSTGVTIEQLASGEAKGKADWWIPQGEDLVPIKAEWVEEDPLPLLPTSTTPPPVDDKAPEGDIVMKPIGSTESDKPPYTPANQNPNNKKNKNK